MSQHRKHLDSQNFQLPLRSFLRGKLHRNNQNLQTFLTREHFWIFMLNLDILLFFSDCGHSQVQKIFCKSHVN